MNEKKLIVLCITLVREDVILQCLKPAITSSSNSKSTGSSSSVNVSTTKSSSLYLSNTVFTKCYFNRKRVTSQLIFPLQIHYWYLYTYLCVCAEFHLWNQFCAEHTWVRRIHSYYLDYKYSVLLLSMWSYCMLSKAAKLIFYPSSYPGVP